jgi:hypothetical protein
VTIGGSARELDKVKIKIIKKEKILGLKIMCVTITKINIMEIPFPTFVRFPGPAKNSSKTGDSKTIIPLKL